MLGVFLLPAFTRLGHERQDLLSPCDEMHDLDLGLYSHPKEVFFFFFFLGGGGGGGMEFEPMLTPRNKSPLPENFPRGGSNPRRCGQRAQTRPRSYSVPRFFMYFSRKRPVMDVLPLGSSGGVAEPCRLQVLAMAGEA